MDRRGRGNDCSFSFDCASDVVCLCLDSDLCVNGSAYSTHSHCEKNNLAICDCCDAATGTATAFFLPIAHGRCAMRKMICIIRIKRIVAVDPNNTFQNSLIIDILKQVLALIEFHENRPHCERRSRNENTTEPLQLALQPLHLLACKVMRHTTGSMKFAHCGRPFILSG